RLVVHSFPPRRSSHLRHLVAAPQRPGARHRLTPLWPPLSRGGPNPGEPMTTETARALLHRHGLPEDIIDGALCLHAQELAVLQRDRKSTRLNSSHVKI